MDFQPAGGGASDTGRGGFELVEVGQVAADHDNPPAHLVAHQRRYGGIGEQVDRKAVEHAALAVDGRAEIDAAAIIVTGRCARQRERHKPWQAWRQRWPAAHDIVAVGLKPHRGLAHLAAGQLPRPIVHERLLPLLELGT